MLTEYQIQFLDKVCPDRWTEENDAISVTGDVRKFATDLTEIPVQFVYTEGYFSCSENKLSTLKGSPFIVGKYFNCDSNQLTNLECGPKEVGGYYSCMGNKLLNLIGAPEICYNNFYCSHNQLTSLEGCPRVIKGNFYCRRNLNLEYLWGIGRVEGNVDYGNHNEINEWIIECMRQDIIFPHFTLEENINWIKREQKYSVLLGSPEEIRKYFSPRILNLVDSGIYNESKILDYNTFKRIC